MSRLLELADNYDRQQLREEEAEEAEFTEVEDEPQLTVEPSQDAEGVAGFIVGIGVGVLRLIEPRLQLDEVEQDLILATAPVVEKHGWHLTALGSAFGYKPEFDWGFSIGRFFKEVARRFRILKEHDKKQRAGQKREYTPTQQPHPVSSEIGLREESNATEEGRYS